LKENSIKEFDDYLPAQSSLKEGDLIFGIRETSGWGSSKSYGRSYGSTTQFKYLIFPKKIVEKILLMNSFADKESFTLDFF
jgi:hypothetical protein